MQRPRQPNKARMTTYQTARTVCRTSTKRRGLGAGRSFQLLLVALCLGICLLAGCQQQATPDAFVARVGEAYLTDEEISAALDHLASQLDTTEARRQFIDQWVTNELLYQEALRRNMRDQPGVQRRLAESERAVLIDALVSQLFLEEEASGTPAEIRAYYERNKEQLRLREPFVRVRYLYSAVPDSAQRARQLLQEATSRAVADSVWLLLVDRFAEDAELSHTLGSNYFPESRLFMEQPRLHERMQQLQPGQIAPLIEINGQTHLLQLAARVPAGSLPELAWVEDQVRRQLTIDRRKQMYERQVQRLRTEAASRDAIEISSPSSSTDGTP